MLDLATTEPTPAPIAPTSARAPRISRKLRKAIDLLAKGKAITQKAAAEAAGLTPEHLSRELAKDHVRVFLALRARSTIAVGVVRASERMIELIDASSEHVSLDASKHVAAIAGIKPIETGTNISIINNVAPGYVIDMRDPRDARPVDAVAVINTALTQHDD